MLFYKILNIEDAIAEQASEPQKMTPERIMSSRITLGAINTSSSVENTVAERASKP